MNTPPAPTPSRPNELADPLGTQTPLYILIPVMLVLIIPIVAISQVAAHTRVDVVDDQMFGYFGWRIAHGAVLYNDVWDNKPPGIYWINALGFVIGNDSYGGVAALCAIAAVSALACYFVIASSLYFRGAAGVATVLAAFYLTHGYFQGGTNRTETFLMAFELAAVALYVRGFARDRWWKWLLAGICCGMAFLFKQVGLAAWGALGLHTIVLVVMRELRVRDGLKRCLLLLGGVLLVVGAATLAIVVQGSAHYAYFAVWSFNRAYFEAGDSSWTNLQLNDYMLKQHMGIALVLPLLMAIASLIHSAFWAIRPHLRPQDVESRVVRLNPVCPRYMLLFAIWYAVAFYGAAISPHHFRHYLLPTLPPLMLMTGYLISMLRTEISLTQRLQQRIWVTACFVAMGYFAVGALKWHWAELSKVWIFRLEQGREADWEVLGDTLATLAEPDDAVQVFGYMPGAYLHARRINAVRYITTEKIGQVKDTPEAEIIRQEMIEGLTANPPALIAMSAGDYDAGVIEEEADSLGLFLRDFLPEQYREKVEIRECNLYVFMRNDIARRNGFEIGD